MEDDLGLSERNLDNPEWRTTSASGALQSFLADFYFLYLPYPSYLVADMSAILFVTCELFSMATSSAFAVPAACPARAAFGVGVSRPFLRRGGVAC